MSASVVNGQGIAQKAIEVANEVAGKPYVWNGKTTEGFDCSGFVAYVLKALLPSNTAALTTNVAGFTTSSLFTNIAQDQRTSGDLIIFPAQGGSPNHIGIVLDATYWIGSQSSTGVAKVKFTNSYWGARQQSYRRLAALSTTALNLGRGAAQTTIA